MNISKILLYIILNLFLFNLQDLNAQSHQELLFDNIDKTKGLPSNFISDIVKDDLGFIWIATNDGLCRYDGPGSVKVYRIDSTQTNIGLASNYIHVLFYDSQDNIWIGTKMGGLTRYNLSLIHISEPTRPY